MGGQGVMPDNRLCAVAHKALSARCSWNPNISHGMADLQSMPNAFTTSLCNSTLQAHSGAGRLRTKQRLLPAR
jgi:hypothetical protein